MSDNNNAWDIAEKAAENQGGGRWLRLKNDGDKAVFGIAGDPRVIICIRDGITLVDAETDEGKALAAKGGKRTTRVRLEIVTFPDNARVEWEMNRSTFSVLSGVVKKYGKGMKFEVTRRGKSGSTDTTYSILPEGQMSKDELSACAAPTETL